MNYKPDDNIIVSYLYGALDEKEKAKFEKYLQEHPAELEKVKEMTNARDIMGALKDKEVIAPPVFMDDRSNVRSLWRSSYFKNIMGIAACVLLLMVAGRLIGMEINYNQGELRISFGGTKQEVPVQSTSGSTAKNPLAKLTSEEVQAMINTSLQRNNESITANWADQQKRIDQSIRQRLDINSRKIDDAMKNATQTSQEQVRSFVAGLQNDNLRLMKDYLQLSSGEQKKYVESLLVDFSKYLQEQRNQDLNLFQTRMNSIEKNSDQFKQETEQILSSIISTASVTKKKNSY